MSVWLKSWVLLKTVGVALISPFAGFYYKKEYSLLAHSLIWIVRIVNTWPFEQAQILFKFRYSIDPIRNRLIIKRDELNHVWISLDDTSDVVLMHIHGGGFCVGIPEMTLDYHYQILLKLKQSGISAKVYSVDYPLAPAHKFPTQLNTVKQAFEHLLLTYRRDQIIVLGESAGGNLALASTFHTLQKPKMILLVSPWLVLEKDQVYPIRNHDIIHQVFLDRCMYAYTNQFESYLVNPTLSPLHLLSTTFSKVPILITYGGQEVLAQDSIVMAQKLQDAGCDVQVDVDEQMIHNYQIADAVFGKHALDGISRMVDFIVRNK